MCVLHAFHCAKHIRKLNGSATPTKLTPCFTVHIPQLFILKLRSGSDLNAGKMCQAVQVQASSHFGNEACDGDWLESAL